MIIICVCLHSHSFLFTLTMSLRSHACMRGCNQMQVNTYECIEQKNWHRLTCTANTFGIHQKNQSKKKSWVDCFVESNSLTRHLNNIIIIERPHEMTYLYVSFETIVAEPRLCVSVVELCEFMFTEEQIELFMCDWRSLLAKWQ